MTSNKPVSATPQKIQTLRPMSLIALYSAATVLFLAYVSFKWVYSHPAQVAIRIEQAVEAVGAGPVVVSGATQETLTGSRAEEIAIEKGDQVVASLLGVHIGDVQIDCGPRGGKQKATAAVEAGGISGGLPILVCSARADIAGRPGAGVNQATEWELPGLPPAGRLRQYAAADPFEVRVRELDLGLSLGDESGKPVWSRRLVLRNLQLSAGADGLGGRIEIARSADCDGGALEFSFAAPGDWVVSGGIENIRDGGGAWTQVLPAPWKTLWRKLSPAGTFSLRIDRLAGSDNSSSFSGRLRSSAWSFRLPVVGLVSTGVNGFAGLRDGTIAWGEDAKLERAAVVLLGQNGTLSGSLGVETGGRLNIAFAEEKIVGSLPGDAPRALDNFFKALRPSGRVQGGLDVSIASLLEDSGTWKLSLALGLLKFHGAPSIVPGTVRLEMAGDTGNKGRGGVAQGELEIEDMTVGGLFSLKGTLGLSWAGGDLVLDVGGLEIRPAAASPGTETRGRLLGRLQTVNGGSTIEGKVSWVGAELRSSLLAALEMSGFAEIELGTGIVLGEGSLKDARVPAGILGEEELVYERGRARWSVDGDGIHIAALELSGAGGAIRAVGTIGFDSHVDLFCILVDEKEAEVLKALPLESEPADWMAVKGQAYRLSGKLEKPLVLPLDPDEQVLKQAGRNDAAGN